MPIRNEASFIEKSLGAVLRQDWPPASLEVLVVDGASTDDTPRLVTSVFSTYRAEAVNSEDGVPRLVLLRNPRRTAPTSLNIGLRAATGDVVLRVDGHCELLPGYISGAVSGLGKWGAACVGGVLETVGEGLAGRAIAYAQSSRFGVGGARFRTGSDGPRPVDTVAFGVYLREVFDRIGGFDEELVRNQDDEFNYRVLRNGGKIWLDPAITVRYHSRSSLRGLWRQYFGYGKFKVRVFQKHRSVPAIRQVVPSAFVVVLIATGAWGALRSDVRPVGLAAAAYVIGNLAAAFSSRQPRLWLMLPLAFAVMHFAYGFGMLWGCLALAGRRR